MNKLKAIGKIKHRADPLFYPSFDVATCREEYQYGSLFLVGVRADTGGTYSVMAASWKFDKYANLSNKDDNGMNKESEIIDSLKATEWKSGEKPPCNVWLELRDAVTGAKLTVLRYTHISERLALYVEWDEPDFEQSGEWKRFAHKLHIDPKEIAVEKIAHALAIEVMGRDAATEINFKTDNDFSVDYRNMAKAIIAGDVPFVSYNGDK